MFGKGLLSGHRYRNSKHGSSIGHGYRLSRDQYCLSSPRLAQLLWLAKACCELALHLISAATRAHGKHVADHICCKVLHAGL